MFDQNSKANEEWGFQVTNTFDRFIIGGIAILFCLILSALAVMACGAQATTLAPIDLRATQNDVRACIAMHTRSSIPDADKNVQAIEMLSEACYCNARQILVRANAPFEDAGISCK